MSRRLVECPRCKHVSADIGRAFDGRRAYRCNACRWEWTSGHAGKKRYSKQRVRNQFHDTGARNG
jgi:transposase-like protein